MTSARFTVATAWPWSRRRESLKSVMSLVVMRGTWKRSLLALLNHATNLRRSRVKARRVLAEKSWASRKEVKRLGFFGGDGCQNIIVGVLHGLPLQCGHEDDALGLLLVG